MKVFIIHRWDGNPEGDWYTSVKKDLEKQGFDVIVPSMPETSAPNIDAWVGHLKKIVKSVDEDTFFIGHSIGCQTILRYLATLPQCKVGGIVFVAGWFTLQGLEDEVSAKIAKPWLTIPIDFKKVKEKTENITVFLSDNDPFVNLEENKSLYKKNLNAKVIIKKGMGHFTKDEGTTTLPEVVSEIVFQNLRNKQ